MRFIISPAKKMVDASDSFDWQGLPALLPQTNELLGAMRKMDRAQLQALWKCSDALADLNFDRVQAMDLESSLTPAIFSYEGIQYQSMAPSVMEQRELDYLQERLRILSGFYGVLRPFDGVTPYRLEMQAKLATEGARDLYSFWSESLFETLRKDELAHGETNCTIVNLASVEYAKAVEPYARAAAKSGDRVRFVTCLFGTVKDGKLAQRSTEVKAARGSFVRWCAENAVDDIGAFREFDVAGYRFEEKLSSPDRLVFVR